MKSFLCRSMRAGTLWVGTDAGGLNRLVNGRITTYLDENGLLGKPIWSILEDREGNLWAGMAGRGLSILKEATFSNITAKDGLPSNTVLPVFEDRDGALWVGTDQGLVKREKERSVFCTKAQGLPDNFIFSITQDPNGVHLGRYAARPGQDRRRQNTELHFERRHTERFHPGHLH